VLVNDNQRVKDRGPAEPTEQGARTRFSVEIKAVAITGGENDLACQGPGYEDNWRRPGPSGGSSKRIEQVDTHVALLKARVPA